MTQVLWPESIYVNTYIQVSLPNSPGKVMKGGGGYFKSINLFKKALTL